MNCAYVTIVGGASSYRARMVSTSEVLGICEEVEVKTSRKRKKQDEKDIKKQGAKTKKKQDMKGNMLGAKTRKRIRE